MFEKIFGGEYKTQLLLLVHSPATEQIKPLVQGQVSQC